MPNSRPETSDAFESGPSFRETRTGQRFCYFHVPPVGVPVRGCILAVHAFAEELNKTRAAVADGARALAEAGFRVLQVDLEGCGDSAGQFDDATWDGWLIDLANAWGWLTERVRQPVWLWGTRLGALLSERFAVTCEPQAAGMLFWQPVVHGAQHLNQFLRLHTVRGMLRLQEAPDATNDSKLANPRDELVAGRAVEVAGYRLGPSLAMSIDAAQMGRHERIPKRINWLQVGPDTVQPLAPVTERLIGRWRTLGSDVAVSTVVGPPFWQTLEIERSPELVEATVSMMCA